MKYLYIILYTVGTLLAISISIAVVSRRRRNKKIDDVFAKRQELDERDFYERYFESQGVPFFIVKKIREILNDVLDADLSRLSAEDNFSNNLSFFFEDDSAADIEITERIEEEFEITLSESDIAGVESWSINNLVNLVWRKVNEKQKSDN
jgi:acyl carrier protein